MFYLHLSKKMNVITRSCMNPPQHQMTPFANPKMHRGSASKSYFYNWYTVCYVHKRGEADLQELPSYFMDCTPHRIIKCTFKQHNRPCGWVVMLAWNWNSPLWSRNLTKVEIIWFLLVFQYTKAVRRTPKNEERCPTVVHNSTTDFLSFHNLHTFQPITIQYSRV